MAGGGSEGWPTSDYMSDTRPGRSLSMRLHEKHRRRNSLRFLSDWLASRDKEVRCTYVCPRVFREILLHDYVGGCLPTYFSNLPS